MVLNYFYIIMFYVKKVGAFMEINVGNKFGCLEVTGDNKQVELEIQAKINMLAKKEWNKFDTWNSGFLNQKFETYYKLDKKEIDLYNKKGKMPRSYVAKFRNNYSNYGNEIENNIPLLWHKKNPNTYLNVKEAYKNKKLYKVRCNICNRVYYMDSRSISCVKWKTCVGSECLKNTIDDEIIDYSKNLYSWENDKNEVQVLDYQLTKAEGLGKCLTYYSLDEQLKIAYISDIHVLHHTKFYNNNVDKTIRAIIDKLYKSLNGVLPNLTFFIGDISSKKEITSKFFLLFRTKFEYTSFEKFKRNLEIYKLIKPKLNFDLCLMERKDRLIKYIDVLKKDLMSEFDFSIFESYKNKYRESQSYVEALEFFKMCKSYQQLVFSYEVSKKIEKIAELFDRYYTYEFQIQNFIIKKEKILNDIKKFEDIHLKPIEDITLVDYKHKMLGDIFVVLGNHEYIDFPNVKSAVEYYEKVLSEMKIRLLHNNSYSNDEYLIYGGTGFAKYDLSWNADNVVCCTGFSREDELRETELFENGYKKALEHAKNNGLCFICISHYPVSACLNNVYNKETIYFTGHNHKNEFVKTENKILYADNQIGYDDNNISFKIATTGYYLNPYYELSDGLYKTSISDYLQFYRYIGEDIGKGNVLYQRCQNGRANLYVLKRKGYYGFFIITKQGRTKGISIVNGGITKKITDSTDISWICDNFDVVLSKYLQTLIPLRNIQEKLSRELKELGLLGNIHGCIVDIDYYHHVMVNPYENTMIFYFSYSFGSMVQLNSFNEVIQSIEATYFKENLYDCNLIRQRYLEKLNEKGYLLGYNSGKCLIEEDKDSNELLNGKEEQLVSRREGMYGVSRKVNPLQRLFSGHVLRAYDLILTETTQKAYRNYLYTNCEFMYDGIHYIVVEDNGNEMIVAQELGIGRDNNTNICYKTRKFSIIALKSKFANKNAIDSYWIK